MFFIKTYAKLNRVTTCPSCPHICAQLVLVLYGKCGLSSGIGKASMSALSAIEQMGPLLLAGP